jgi:hypothetical protein
LLVFGQCDVGDDMDPGPGSVACTGGLFSSWFDSSGKHLGAAQRSVSLEGWPVYLARADRRRELVVTGYLGLNDPSPNDFAPSGSGTPATGAFLSTTTLR